MRLNLGRWALLAVLVLGLLGGGGCGPSPEGPIIVFGSPDSPRMRLALSGLEAALGQGPLEAVFVPELGDEGQRELSRIRRRRPRLLIVLGTPALLRVAPKVRENPVVFALVANPYFTGAAFEPKRPQEHVGNITGLASPPPLTAALQQGASLLGPKTWGLLYDPNDGTAVELKDKFLQEAPRFGLTPLLETGTDTETDRQGLESLLNRGARVIYLPPAATAARYAELLLTWGRDQKVLVVSGYPEGAHKGAALWVVLDYHKLGEETGALAKRVLSGEAPARIPLREAIPLKVEMDEGLLRRWTGYPPVNNNKGGKGEK